MKILRKTLHIGGMSCVNCEHRIRYVLKTAPGIQDATVSYNTGLAHVTYDTDTISLKQIREIIEKNGYTILPETGTSDYDMKKNFVSLAVILFLYALLQHFGILNLLAPGQLADTKMGYGMLFVIGLITSVHCIAMCGGINLSQCIPQPSNASDVSGSSRALDIFLPALLYNTGRVISYTAIGFLLGLVGMLLGTGTQTGISYFLQGSLKMIAGIFMVIMGINMLGIFPWLRPLTLRIPRFLSTKVLKKRASSRQPLFVDALRSPSIHADCGSGLPKSIFRCFIHVFIQSWNRSPYAWAWLSGFHSWKAFCKKNDHCWRHPCSCPRSCHVFPGNCISRYFRRPVKFSKYSKSSKYGNCRRSGNLDRYHRSFQCCR